MLAVLLQLGVAQMFYFTFAVLFCNRHFGTARIVVQSRVCELSVCPMWAAAAGGFAAVGPAGRSYRSIAARLAVSSSRAEAAAGECGQYHVVS